MPQETISKQCPKCKEVKEKTSFHKSSSRLDKLALYCKQCDKVAKDKRNAEKKANAMYGII